VVKQENVLLSLSFPIGPGVTFLQDKLSSVRKINSGLYKKLKVNFIKIDLKFVFMARGRINA